MVADNGSEIASEDLPRIFGRFYKTADCLADVVIGRPPRPLNLAYIGQGIALGRHEAVGFNNFPDDTPKWPTFTGRLGFYSRGFFRRPPSQLAKH